MGNSHKNLLVWNQLLNWNQTLIKQSLNGPFPKLRLVVPPSDQDGCTAVLSLTQSLMGNSHKNHLVWNQQLNQNQALMAQSLDGPLPKLCPAVALSHQDGHHSAVALLLKAALIQVSDYRLLGASGLNTLMYINRYMYRYIDLFYENKFLRAISPRRQKTRCNMLREIHLEKIISDSMSYQGFFTVTSK